MRSVAGSVAVVTGAGSGIGRATAQLLASLGADLALADINEAGLEATRALLPRERKVTTRKVDVSEVAEMEAFRDQVERDFGRASILVNNAGVALYGRFDHISLADFEWIMGINFWGAVYGSQLFLPLLEREPAANIVTISSIFGIVAPPLQSGYCAAKFAVRGFSEVLRHELAPTNVRLTVVHPGGIKTQIAATARTGAFANQQHRDVDTKNFEKSFITTPEAAAKRILGGILHDRPRVLIGGDARFVDVVQRFFPARYLAVLRPLIDPKGDLAKRLEDGRRPQEQSPLSSERVAVAEGV